MSTLYERAACNSAEPTAVERARRRVPNNEKPASSGTKQNHDKITGVADEQRQEQIQPELPEELPLEEYPNDDTSLPGSLGKLATELRNAIGIMSETEMAAILQVSHETLATWRTKRRGPPHVKIGKRAFYLVSDFTAWVTGEVERQSAFTGGRKHQRKRKRQPKGDARDERENHVSEMNAQGMPADV